MKISVLVENTSDKGLNVEHGLSLYIELANGCCILFDAGQSELFLENARLMGCDVGAVDYAVLSHGHYDHGGGLRTFLQNNAYSCIYAQKTAFLSYYSMKEYGLKNIGLDESLKVDYNDRIELCSGIRTLCEGVTLFTCRDKNFPQPECNSLLYGPDKKTNDDFSHEQSLLIEESENVVLIAGCAHSGILNIMQVAEHLIDRKITHVVSGFHLMQSCDCKELESLSELLATHKGCKYYTMHCTGKTQYKTLCQYMKNNILYLSCGDTIEID